MHSTHPGILQDHPQNITTLYLIRIISIMCITYPIIHIPPMIITDPVVTIQSHITNSTNGQCTIFAQMQHLHRPHLQCHLTTLRE